MLHEFQSSFKSSILQNQVAKNQFSTMRPFLSRQDDAARMDIYRNNIFVSLINTLSAAFPKTSELVGVDNFTLLAKKFIETNPPQEAQLSHYGADFPCFLSGWKQVVADIPYLPDLARLDWMYQQAYFAPSYQPVDLSEYNSLQPEELFEARLKIGHSVFIGKMNFPVGHFMDMETLSIEQCSPANEYLMVYRYGDTEKISNQYLDESEFLFLHSIESGYSLGEVFLDVAAEFPHFDLQATLTRFFGKSVFMQL